LIVQFHIQLSAQIKDKVSNEVASDESRKKQLSTSHGVINDNSLVLSTGTNWNWNAKS